MIVGSGGPTSPWELYILLPALTFLVSVVAIMVGAFPHMKSWWQDRTIRQERLDNGLDTLLGREAIPEAGKEEIIGLNKRVPALEKRVETIEEEIGKVDPDESLVQIIRNIQRDVHNIRRPQRGG